MSWSEIIGPIVWTTIQILVVLYVFSRLDDRMLIILVAILGLIFVAIASGLSLTYWFLQFRLGHQLLNMENDLLQIRRQLGDDVSKRQADSIAARDKSEKDMRSALISGLSGMPVSIVCMYQLFSVL
jgi:hypothetical protein